MTETADRPLVTFALFAYNQEQYIREAVEGAFAQTYEPLEIILSDDCSTDRTFEIMQEMAAAYQGPHEVRVRRNSPNFGTALHVGAVAGEMRGSLLVVAAGDDISRAERTEMLVAAWRGAGFPIGTVHSTLTPIHATDPDKEAAKLRHKPHEKIDIKWFLKYRSLPFLPPTCAYTRELFTQFPPILGGSVIEDSVLACRSMLIGQSIPVDKPLVLKRRLTISAGQGYTIDEPKRWNIYIRSKLIARINRLQDTMASPPKDLNTLNGYQKLLTQEMEGLSRCFVKTQKVTGPLSKTMIFLRLIYCLPKNKSLGQRVFFSVKSVGWEQHPLPRRLVSAVRTIRHYQHAK